MEVAAAHALIRFGLGPRRAEAPPSDPRAWLLGQLAGRDDGPGTAVPSSTDGLAALRFDRETKPEANDRRVPPIAKAAAHALMDHALTTDRPFRERLVWFWANHFTVSTRQGGTNAVVGAFVQEAIRPHVTGRFDAMLLAVMRHPAMIMYLDNAGSVGPDSPAGQRGHRGLNENLARECLELHTVGPAAGYTQADVTAFAQILTGWSIELKQNPPGFLFRDRAHQPGAKSVLGQTFPEGEAGGLQALAFLANHPATYRHLATKLARHFVADDPPPTCVHEIERRLRDSGGDLGAASAALVRLPQAWQHPLAKLRSPQDYVFAVLRATGLPADKRPDAAGLMGALGQPLFAAPLPNGWPDAATDWASPEGMLRRIDWAYGFAGRLNEIEPMDLADASLGRLLRAPTSEAIQHAGSRREAMTLLLTAPEFQRR
jgi:uncharacterized protein (DUF1800 family)